MGIAHDALLDVAERFVSAEEFKQEANRVYAELTGGDVPTERSFYTVADVANRWGCTDTHVRRLIDGGKLKAYRLGKGYRVATAELAAYERRSACNNGARIQ